MKKVTINVNGVLDKDAARQVSKSLNDLSGVVAADVSLPENRAFAYAGDKLSDQAIINAVQKAGFSGAIINEQYITDLDELNNSLGF